MNTAGSEQKYGVLIDVSGPKPLLGFEFLRCRLIEGVKEAGIFKDSNFPNLINDLNKGLLFLLQMRVALWIGGRVI